MHHGADMGTIAEEKKMLIAYVASCRESQQSWRELLLDAEARGLEVEPSLVPAPGRWASGKRSAGSGPQVVISRAKFIEGIEVKDATWIEPHPHDLTIALELDCPLSVR